MWVIEKAKGQAYKAKWGKELKSTDRFDSYEFSCVIEGMGDGIALVENASGNAPISDRSGFFKALKELGFKKVRWIRIIEKDLQNIE